MARYRNELFAGFGRNSLASIDHLPEYLRAQYQRLAVGGEDSAGQSQWTPIGGLLDSQGRSVSLVGDGNSLHEDLDWNEGIDPASAVRMDPDLGLVTDASNVNQRRFDQRSRRNQMIAAAIIGGGALAGASGLAGAAGSGAAGSAGVGAGELAAAGGQGFGSYAGTAANLGGGAGAGAASAAGAGATSGAFDFSPMQNIPEPQFGTMNSYPGLESVGAGGGAGGGAGSGAIDFSPMQNIPEPAMNTMNAAPSFGGGGLGEQAMNWLRSNPTQAARLGLGVAGMFGGGSPQAGPSAGPVGGPSGPVPQSGSPIQGRTGDLQSQMAQAVRNNIVSAMMRRGYSPTGGW